jgi:hypothetical protein
VPPSNTGGNEAISPAVEVAIVDTQGNVVPLSGVEIEIEVFRESGNGNGNHPFEGDPTRDTVDGIAVFPDLELDHDHDDYRMRASAPDMPELGSVVSPQFEIQD